MRNERAVVPASVVLEGEYGLEGIAMSPFHALFHEMAWNAHCRFRWIKKVRKILRSATSIFVM